jgi:hypothetical protein
MLIIQETASRVMAPQGPAINVSSSDSNAVVLSTKWSYIDLQVSDEDILL